MAIEKISDNNYRVRKMVKGIKYTLKFDHRPSQKEITIALAEAFEGNQGTSANAGTVYQYAIDYIEKSRVNKRSSTTIINYQSIIRNTPPFFLELDFFDVTQADVQDVIDEYSKTHSPKSVRNLNGFYMAIFKEFRPSFIINIKLPMKKKNFEYQPTTRDVQRILEYIKGTRYELFLNLSVLGLRRSEIPCLSKQDIVGNNTLIINKDYVLDENNKYYIKNSPKTDATNRTIPIPQNIADMIKESEGMIFTGNPHTVNEFLHKAQDDLNIPRFRLHILRHFAAAYLMKKGFTTVQIENYMGWEHGSSTMQKVYAYNLDPEESQKDIVNAFDELN